MAVSSFARFKGGFDAPELEGGPEALERRLGEPARFLAAGLNAAGVSCDEPRWCDFEYEMVCTVGERRYTLSVSYDYLEWEWFEISHRPATGFLGRLFARGDKAAEAQLSGAIDTVLRQRQGVLDLRWYAKPLSDPDKGYAQHPEGVPT